MPPPRPARAGEDGRGFAVVAGEVRTLDWRGAGAAIDDVVATSHRVDELPSEAVFGAHERPWATA